jgi:hypothetical protein
MNSHLAVSVAKLPRPTPNATPAIAEKARTKRRYRRRLNVGSEAMVPQSTHRLRRSACANVT